jgi:CO/xanthine dehydrogenase FAD-binding subunit
MVTAFTPRTLAEALRFRDAGPSIPFAGGTDLMVRRKRWSGTAPRFEQPALFIGGLPELQGITTGDGVLTIGAATTLTALLEDGNVPALLQQAVAQMASPAIRNGGTLGGNLCNASPAADTMPPLYALDAAVVLQSAAGTRELPIEEFIQGPGRTALAGNELLVAVRIPLRQFKISAYRKVGTRKADALSKLSFAAVAEVDDGKLTELRIALGAVAPRVVRSRAAEELLLDRPLRQIADRLPEIQAAYAELLRPIDDQRSSATYRRTVAWNLIRDFLLGLHLKP